MNDYLTKGSRVRAQLSKVSDPLKTSLAGFQTKFNVNFSIVEGIVTSIKGDDPDNPTTIRVFIQLENGEIIDVAIKNVLEIIG